MSGRKIHMIGVGGVGMAGLAVLLKARGHDDLPPAAQLCQSKRKTLPEGRRK